MSNYHAPSRPPLVLVAKSGRLSTTLYWLLGSSVQNHALRDGERSPSPACKHRRVGVQSEVVTSILMLEQRYSQVMEKLLLWVMVFPLSSG
jgi:hypothetical protein